MVRLLSFAPERLPLHIFPGKHPLIDKKASLGKTYNHMTPGHRTACARDEQPYTGDVWWTFLACETDW